MLYLCDTEHNTLDVVAEPAQGSDASEKQYLWGTAAPGVCSVQEELGIPDLLKEFTNKLTWGYCLLQEAVCSRKVT